MSDKYLQVVANRLTIYPSFYLWMDIHSPDL